jgi:Icc protein
MFTMDRTIRVVHLSDSHLAAAAFGSVAFHPASRLRAAVRACAEVWSHIDFAVITGDISNDGTAISYATAASLLKSLGVPVLAVPGNHDAALEVRKAFPSQALEAGAWRALAVDSSRPNQSHGCVDVDEITDRLDRLDTRPTILAMHHPPASPSNNPVFQLENATELVAALSRRPHVKAVVSGHLHRAFSLRLAPDLTVFGAPSTLVGFRHFPDGSFERDEQSVGANLLRLSRHGRIAARTIETSR